MILAAGSYIVTKINFLLIYPVTWLDQAQSFVISDLGLNEQIAYHFFLEKEEKMLHDI